MLGLTYGEVFLIIGATIAVVGPKDVPKIARAVGRLAGRAVGYVQSARGQMQDIMQKTQAKAVHKELQEALGQLEAIRHEIRSITLVNPPPLTRKFVHDSEPSIPRESHIEKDLKLGLDTQNDDEDFKTKEAISKVVKSEQCNYASLQSQAAAYSRLAEASQKSNSQNLQKPSSVDGFGGTDQITVLPVSAESAGLLPKQKERSGSDVVLEAILEADVAHHATEFFKKAEAEASSQDDDLNSKHLHSNERAER
eukprot:TRINITY_DN1760_c0_g1_i1.p1 TRINITY_DN1760_c0_g1~~TRINITY_DN1760_c0_g1_i1.p1  ORF type:complete len:253 (-),score=77.83 TRINITY_DN1760_c0_g1_i1:482-1240(-)